VKLHVVVYTFGLSNVRFINTQLKIIIIIIKSMEGTLTIVHPSIPPAYSNATDSNNTAICKAHNVSKLNVRRRLSLDGNRT